MHTACDTVYINHAKRTHYIRGGGGGGGYG